MAVIPFSKSKRPKAQPVGPWVCMYMSDESPPKTDKRINK